ALRAALKKQPGFKRLKTAVNLHFLNGRVWVARRAVQTRPFTGTRSAPVNRSRICAELTRIRQMRKLLSCATCRTTIYAILAARRAVGMTQFRAFVEFTSCMTELQTNNLYRAAKRSL
ncbi:MAG TPA: hypothetical protein V6C78_30065, partial [Crinalium sp.]